MNVRVLYLEHGRKCQEVHFIEFWRDPLDVSRGTVSLNVECGYVSRET